MKILVLTPSFIPIIGGAELGIYEVYRRLGRTHTVRILTPLLEGTIFDQTGAYDTHLQQFPCEIYRFEDRWSLLKVPGQNKLKGTIPPFSLSFTWQAFKQIQDFKPDVINIHYATGGGLTTFIARYFRIPVLLSLVGREVQGPYTPKFWKIYINTIIKNATETMFLTEWSKQLFSPDKGQIVPYGVDANRFTPDLDTNYVQSKLNVSPNTIVFFALQRLASEKNPETVLHALKLVVEKHNNALLVLGGKGPLEKHLKQMTETLNLSDKVIFTGYISEALLPQYFAFCDIFILHSLSETFGIALVQAMACGKPIISTNITAIPDVIKQDVNGVLVPPFNPGALAQAMCQLIENPEKAHKMGQLNRLEAKIKYDWNVVVRKFEDLLVNIVA